MKINIYLISMILICVSISCKQRKVSDTGKIIIDNAYIKSKIAGYDSLRVDTPFNIVTTYYFKDHTILVYQDKLGHFRGCFKQIGGVNVEGVEFYPLSEKVNGKFTWGKDSSNKTTYYYENGRVKSTQYYKNFKAIGDWKYYNKEGNLDSIVHQK